MNLEKLENSLTTYILWLRLKEMHAQLKKKKISGETVMREP